MQMYAFFRVIDLVVKHHMGDGVKGLHFAGKQMLTPVGIAEILTPT